MEELVSIVIPIYNVESFLDRCLDSITGQTYENIEIILVDDGSTDSSGAICDRWAEKDDRITVIHKENAGAGMARNTGISHATGRYIFFVDSDDYMDITAVEKCLTTARETGADVVMFGRCDVYADGTVRNKHIKNDKLFFDGEAVIGDILSGLFTYRRGLGISVWGKMFDLGLITDNCVSFKSERELISEDAYFLLELFEHVRAVALLPENLYYYNKNENSFSRSYKEGHQRTNDAFLTESLKLCEALGYPDEVSRCVKSRYHTYALVGMKQIISAKLQSKVKRKALRAAFDNELLHSTMTDEVLKLDIPPSRIFWKLYRKKCYFICYLLLWYKAHF